MIVSKGFRFAMLAGLTAASASVFAKLAFASQIDNLVCSDMKNENDSESELKSFCQYVIIFCK